MSSLFFYGNEGNDGGFAINLTDLSVANSVVMSSATSTFKVAAYQFESNVATGTAPFIVASTSKVNNLYGNMSDIANGLATTGATVVVNGASPPSVGQVLTALSATTANWSVPGALTASYKTAVRVATTADGTLASAYENGDTVDGVVLATGDRILLKNQSTGSENGIYTVNASGAPTRATDYAATSSAAGTTIPVLAGTQASTFWYCTNAAGSDVVGTDALTFTELSSNLTLLDGRSGGQSVSGGTLTTENLTLRANEADLTGQVNVITTTNSTTPTSGALAVSGGLGVALDANIGGDLKLGTNGTGSSFRAYSVASGASLYWDMTGTSNQGQLQVNSNTNASSSSTGALIVTGGVGIAQDLYVGGTIYGKMAPTSIAYSIQREASGSPGAITDPNLTSTVTIYQLTLAGTYTATLANGTVDGFLKTIIFGEETPNNVLDITVTSFTPANGGGVSTKILRMKKEGQGATLIWSASAPASWLLINGGAQVV